VNGRVSRSVTLPNSFKKGLSAALSKFDEYQLVKYESNEWPRFRDVAQVVYRRKNYPITQELLTYLLSGEVVNPSATPIIAARKELNSLTQWSAVVPEMAKKAHVTWEEMLSKFGNKKEVWEALIDGGRATLPVMAAVRNLRNMEQAGISTGHWSKVRDLIMSHNDNKMMPFRFISARKAVSSAPALSIADLLLDKASMNIQDIPGTTCILPDNSGSMNSRISEKSEMTKLEVANSLAAVLAKRLGDRVCVAAFGTKPVPVTLSLADSAYRNYEAIGSAGNRAGGSTEGGAAIRHLTQTNTFVDRIIMLSDMQCYTRGSSAGNVQPALAEYKAKVNPNVKFISVDIGGHGTSQAAPDKNVWLSTGMNESIVAEILAFEGLLTDNANMSEGTLSLSMDYVRANY
jgi:60 kDa SS-A/Ro ribonucleoprotein